MPEILAIISYLSATLLIAIGVRANRTGFFAIARGLAAVGVAFHAAAFGIEYAAIDGFSADFFTALSVVSLLMLAVLLLLTLRWPVTELLLLALPGSVCMIALKLLAGPEPVALDTGQPMLDLHIMVSLLSYSILSIAAITALFIAVLHNLLRRRVAVALIEIMPPLVSMENLLFRIIWIGWILLTVSLSSGLMFVDNVFAQHLGHKTFLSIISWFVFGALLFGRWRFGWRGMRAVRLSLIGMAILVLAYFGSKAVLELLLQLRWRAS